MAIKIWPKSDQVKSHYFNFILLFPILSNQRNIETQDYNINV